MHEPMTKERLKRYYWLVKEIEHQTERIKRIDTAITSPGSPRLDGMPGSGYVDDAIADKIAYKMGIEQLRTLNIANARHESAQIELAVQQVANPRDRELMRMRYLDGMSWDDIADALSISHQWATSLHGRILQEMCG